MELKSILLLLLLTTLMLLLLGCGTDQMESNCVDDASPIFTNHITDLQRVGSIVNLGMVSDNTIAQHTYIHPMQDSDSDSSYRKIPIYAPMQGQLYDAGYSV